jgi:TolB-like protein
MSATAHAAVDAPVAVMPFKNISGELSLDWLKVGIAETLVSDLQKGAHLQVVERSQLDHALAELALQNSPLGDDATASQVGKLTGAQTVVVGSFQADGKQLRIAARFVRVSTGEVLDTAKVTGPLDDIFLLQDQIVAKLTGQVAPAPAAPASAKDPRPRAEGRSPRKRGAQEVKAYQLYAMSLTTSSDAEKVGYLRRSLQEDPELSYALDDLAALESRMKGYRKANEEEGERRESELITKLLRKEGTPQERMSSAYQLLSAEMAGMRWAQLLVDASRVAHMDLPAMGGTSPGEFARSSIVTAHAMLKHQDAVLQTGERFLKDFPGSLYFPSVENAMKQVINEKREAEEGKAKLPEALAAIDKREKEVGERRPVTPYQVRIFAQQRCQAHNSHHQYATAIDFCRAQVAAHASDVEDPKEESVEWMRYAIVQAEASLGRFDAARGDLAALVADRPAFMKAHGLATFGDYWPKD